MKVSQKSVGHCHWELGRLRLCAFRFLAAQMAGLLWSLLRSWPQTMLAKACFALFSFPCCVWVLQFTPPQLFEFVAHSAHTFDVTPLYWAHPLLCRRLPFSPFRRTLSRGRWQYWPWSSFFRHSVLRAIPTSLRHGAGRATLSLQDWVWHTWVQIPFPRLAKFVSLVKAVNFSGPLFPHL